MECIDLNEGKEHDIKYGLCDEVFGLECEFLDNPLILQFLLKIRKTPKNEFII